MTLFKWSYFQINFRLCVDISLSNALSFAEKSAFVLALGSLSLIEM